MQMAAERCSHPSSTSIPRLLWKPSSILWDGPALGAGLCPSLSPAGKRSWEITLVSREPGKQGSQAGFELCPAAQESRNSQGQEGAAALQSILPVPLAGPVAAAAIPGLPLIPAVLVPAAHLLDGDESPEPEEEEEGWQVAPGKPPGQLFSALPIG